MTELLEKRLSEVAALMESGIYTANEGQFLLQLLKAQATNIESLREENQRLRSALDSWYKYELNMINEIGPYNANSKIPGFIEQARLALKGE
jgi:hypothetical protein